MLTLSDTTVAVVRELTGGGQLPDSAGMRLSAQAYGDGQPGSIHLMIVEAPEASDQVIEEHGAHVFVDAELAPDLDDKLLDADVDKGQVTFSLAERPGD